MKLNYKKTIFVGFAFFLICVFWQAYESIVPLMLVNKFGMSQMTSGFIMSLDNIMSVVLLPVFGAISDKSKSKYGKRTPFIIVGTVIAIVMFMTLSFIDAGQLKTLYKNGEGEKFQEMLWNENEVVTNAEYSVFINKGKVDNEYKLQDYACKVNFNKVSSEVSQEQLEQAKSWFVKLNTIEAKANEDNADAKFNYYYYNYDTNEYSFENNGGTRASAFNNLVSSARSVYAGKITSQNKTAIVLFIAVLLIVLLSMSLFRSPAVALMPDVTIKPLRSQANAIINLMGTLGGILVLVLGILFKTGKIANQVGDYRFYVSCVCLLMAGALAVFLLFVKENKWGKEMQEQSKQLGIDVASDEVADLVDEKAYENGKEESMTDMYKNNKGKFFSLILIMVSVALWYMGYNALTSKYSLYAQTILHKDFNTTLLIAQAAAVVAYIPVGFIAGKFGRKKTILAGVALLAISIFVAGTFNSETPSFWIDTMFAFAGIGWATINVNSFPMVVEMAKGGDVGKYTGYYYMASMTAQVITPTLSGALMDYMGSMRPLFFYSSIFIALAFVTMFFVKHGDNLTLKEQKTK